jgi:C_GCAxxG_C_C family probable redox protein
VAYREADLETGSLPRHSDDHESRPAAAGSRERLLDATAQMAFSHLAVYGNCCRSTLAAVQIHLRCVESVALRVSTVLAGGIAGTGQTCGAVLGGLMALGQVLGTDDFRDRATAGAADVRAKALVDDVLDWYGSTNCHGIQTALVGFACDDPAKLPRWREEDGASACASVCARVARRAAELILDEAAGPGD